MSEPIRVGDLVQIVKPMPCCGRLGKHYGDTFTVSEIITTRFVNACAYCGARYAGTYAVDPADDLAAEVRRLKRIPPLSELESTETKEELPA